MVGEILIRTIDWIFSLFLSPCMSIALVYSFFLAQRKKVKISLLTAFRQVPFSFHFFDDRCCKTFLQVGDTAIHRCTERVRMNNEFHPSIAVKTSFIYSEILHESPEYQV